MNLLIQVNLNPTIPNLCQLLSLDLHVYLPKYFFCNKKLFLTRRMCFKPELWFTTHTKDFSNSLVSQHVFVSILFLEGFVSGCKLIDGLFSLD